MPRRALEDFSVSLHLLAFKLWASCAFVMFAGHIGHRGSGVTKCGETVADDGEEGPERKRWMFFFLLPEVSVGQKVNKRR